MIARAIERVHRCSIQQSHLLINVYAGRHDHLLARSITRTLARAGFFFAQICSLMWIYVVVSVTQLFWLTKAPDIIFQLHGFTRSRSHWKYVRDLWQRFSCERHVFKLARVSSHVHVCRLMLARWMLRHIYEITCAILAYFIIYYIQYIWHLCMANIV